jgi:hypothetical protein
MTSAFLSLFDDHGTELGANLVGLDGGVVERNDAFDLAEVL